MHIELKLEIDRGTGLPYWDSRIKENGETLRQIVSTTFHPKDDKGFKDRFENATVRTMKELEQVGDLETIKRMLIQKP